MNQPRLSILLPFRDAADTLGECLDSLLAQSESRWELVAVDDHSSDGSAELIRSRFVGDPRLRLLPNPGRGLVQALDAGLRACRTPIVARMDADDLMLPGRLTAQLAHFEANPDLTLSATRVELFSDGEILAGSREYLRWQNGCLTPEQIARDLYIESPFAHPSVAFRRHAILETDGYREGPFPEDYDLWLRLHRLGHRMEKLPQVLLRWRDHPQRLSRTDPRCSRQAFDRLRAHYLARDPRFLAHAQNFAIWGAGRKTRRRCDHLLQQGYRPKAWIDIDPRKIGNRVDGIPVVDARWLKAHGRPFVLVYVTNHGAREEIMEELETMGYRPGKDCLAVG